MLTFLADHLALFVSLILSGLHLLGIFSAVHAIMASRTSQGAIAWGMALTTFPYLSLPAYWIFGRSRFQGYVTARCLGDNQVSSITSQCAQQAAPHISPQGNLQPTVRAVEELARIPLLGGNQLQLLIDGPDTFNSIIDGISQAHHYVLIQFFIVNDDELGRRIKRLLMQKAQAGVKVYFLFDEVGSHDLPAAYINELARAGVDVHDFNSKQGPSRRFQLNFRNHRKIVVVDGHTAWLGGHNIGDSYLGNNPKFGRWRDTHVKLQGPAVAPVQVAFLEDYNWAVGQVLELDWQMKASGEQEVLIVPSGPADELETASLMFVHLINAARERIWIASPYFVPDEPVMAALQLAGLRGVDVRILIPDQPDHLLVYLAAFAYFDEAGATGVGIYRYRDGFLHQKVMLIDNQWAGVGTANLDNRSFRLNFEITALVHDQLFASQVEEMLSDDFSHARRMEGGDYGSKPFYFKVAVRLARLMSPLL